MFLALLVNAIFNGSIYGAVGLGYNLIYKASGLMNLSQGDFLMVGAFVGLTFYQFLQLPFVVALLCTMAVMFVIGMAIEHILVAGLVKRGAEVSYIILCTIAVSMLLQNAAMLTWGANTKNFPHIFSVNKVRLGNVSIAPESLLVVVVAMVCMFALHFYMNKTKFGTAMRAAALDQKAASALGINVARTKAVTWGISACIAGAVGMAVGPMLGVYVTMGVMISSKGFASAVTGGYGNMYGAIVGGLFFGVVETIVAAFVSTMYKDLFSFLILIVVMIFMPTGFFRANVLE